MKTKKTCNCTKTQCLKLYCDCFARGEVCSNCKCLNCYNNAEHDMEHHKAISVCLSRDPEAFRPKIDGGRSGEVKAGRHNKGCNCKRSCCLKNYCECYEAKIMCSSTCKCVGCLNFGDNSEMRTGVWRCADISPSEKMQDKHHLPVITPAVVEATCGCLLAQAEDAAWQGYSSAQAERVVLEEFGQCFTQIVKALSKSTAC